MKLTKIVYIVRKNFCYQKEYYDFGCDVMKSHGVDVEIWCDVFMYTPDSTIPGTVYDGDELRYIYSIGEYHENIERVKSDTVIFVLFLGDNRDELGCEIRKTIRLNGMQYCDLSVVHCAASTTWVIYPDKYRKLLVGKRKTDEINEKYYSDIEMEKKRHKVIKCLKRLSSLGMLGKIKRVIKLYTSNNPDTIVCEKYPALFSLVPTKFEAAILQGEPKRVYNGNNVLCINSPDYDRFLDENPNNDPIVQGEYAVFIDNGGRRHPDLPEIINTDEKDALKCINIFIEEVERIFSLKVVIALHPRVPRSSEEFGGREVYVNCTENLIHHCKLVLNPGSTVTSLIVLWNKPMIFYTPLLSEESDYERRGRISVEIFSSVFNADYFDIRNDKPEKLKKCLIQSSERYELYREVFVKDKDSPDKKQFEIVYDALMEV